MPDDVHVIEDGVDSPPATKASQPTWVLGVVAFAVGVALGALINGSPGTQASEPVPMTGVIEDAVVEPTPGTDAADPGVAGAIADFPDAIVAIARNPGGALDHVLWPKGGEVIVRPITRGESVILDVNAHFVAMSDGVPDLEGSVLSVGRFNSIGPVASGVLSYAWHDSQSAALSYTALAGDGTRLETVRGGTSEVVTELPLPELVIVGWGDWGWALQSGDEVVLLNAHGEFRDTEPGLGFATHHSGWTFAVEDPGAKLISSGGGVKRVENPLNVGKVLAAEFAPDGGAVAVAGETGLAVVDIESGDVRKLEGPSAPSMSWSSDSRFVLIPTSSGVVVFDLAGNGDVYPILSSYPVVAVGVSPLRSS